MALRRLGQTVLLGSALSGSVMAAAAPQLYPSTGNGLWYTQPADFDSWTTEWLPIGNGFLAAMVQGETAQEAVQLNIESLWSGGPFQDPSYNGGNKQPSDQSTDAEQIQDIRQAIFQSSTGTIDNIEQLTTDAGAYGSYVGAGYFLTSMDVSGDVSNFTRWLDLDGALHETQWTQGNTTFLRDTFCSNPAQVCVQHIDSIPSDSSILPTLTYAYSLSPESGVPTPTISCFDNSTLKVRGTASDPGMDFEILARIVTLSTGGNASVSCAPAGTNNATISVSGANEAWMIWVGGTNYDMNAGDAAHNFSFLGVDPHNNLVTLIDAAAKLPYNELADQHVKDFQAVIQPFNLDLKQKADFNTPTDQLVAAYQTDVGSPYLEWLLFNFGRYLLASSSRGVMPANLQGKWAKDSSNPWSADYHSNINIQMNYWFAEFTGMDVVQPLFDYIEKTWAPRGATTAQYLYNISEGWVTHNEMNIFGHTGMKGGGNTASWADYPESNAWMMLHVWDHFDINVKKDWFKAQGWPLLKSVAQFHMQKLVPDERFNDSTLIVAPCNSPEQVPITLGCAHAQQLIWQLFNAIEKGFPYSGDDDTRFLNEVLAKREKMDKGIHIGSWGQLQEWKVDMDSPTDTHRHLSHLIGLYPGYAVASYNATLQSPPGESYTTDDVIAAATTSLIHRGNGTGPDADSGWEKVWRAACWAQLGNSSEFYHELSYAFERNFGPNLLSLYQGDAGPDAIFQIDANFGFPAAIVNAIIQEADQPSMHDVFQIHLTPAVPAQWPSGSMSGIHLRGGLTWDLSWDPTSITSAVVNVDANAIPRTIQVMHKGKEIKMFTTQPGMRMRVI